MTRLNAEIDDDVYDKWSSHSQDGDKYSNLSHLIRVAVTNQIKYDNNYGNPFGEATESDDNIEDELGELKADLNKTLESFQNDIQGLKVELKGTDDDQLLSNLMTGLHDRLVVTTREDVEAGNVSGTTVEEIQKQAGSDIDELDIRKSLSKLVQDIPTVESFVDEDNTRHYYEKR
jgi:hypothetical protein